MADGRVREEVVNAALAHLLSRRGIISIPESRVRTEAGTRVPDVVVAHFQGLRVVLEGKLASGEGARELVLKQADSRVQEGLAHICIAVLYPASVAADGSFARICRRLESCELEIAICTEARLGGWTDSDVDRLGELLRRTFDELIEEDIVAVSVADLETGVESFAKAALVSAASVDRCGSALGIFPDSQDDQTKRPTYTDAQRVAISRIAGLALTNALLFQEVLAADEARVQPIRPCLRSKDPVGVLEKHWQFILNDIDYVPIFRVAREILLALPASKDLEESIQILGSKALRIISRRAALRHDLMGRVFHQLLVEKKYLATFYTSIPAATLLLKLALTPDEWALDWSDTDQISELQLVDLACGTGTLLMAAAEAISDNYVAGCARKGSITDLPLLHKVLMEHVILGFDVLPSALHLTASTLALRAAAVAFAETHLYLLPHGGESHRLGSIEFLRSPEIRVAHDLFGGVVSGGEQIAGGTRLIERDIARPKADLCVMNPPFTRSVGGNLLFGSVPEEERRRMARRLQRMLRGLPEGRRQRALARAERRPPVMASATAGLGSVFVAVGNESVKNGGRMALVLPKALLSGVAWDKTRQLLANEYQLEYIIASHEPGRWNFSENTNLSEVLIIARKIGPAGTEDGDVTAVNLWRNPGTAWEAMNIADQLAELKAPDVESGQGALGIRVAGRKTGEALAIPWADVKRRSWMPQAAFAQAELIRTLHHLLYGNVYVPGRELVGFVPLIQLGELGRLGPDRRDIWDGFEKSDRRTNYPALWGHVENAYMSMLARPNQFLAPLPAARRGRPLRRASELWRLAGRVVLAERLRLNTNRQVAVLTGQPVLANVWWPFAITNQDEEAERALVLWLNSTLGTLMTIGCREETEGAWISLKKPTWTSMPVIDTNQLTGKEKGNLASAFDRIGESRLEAFPSMAEDPVRSEIDAAVANTFNLPDLAPIRELLAAEPVVCLKAI